MKIDKSDVIQGLKSKEIKSVSGAISGCMEEGFVTIVGNQKTLKLLGYVDPDYLFSKSPEEKAAEAKRKKEPIITKIEKKQ